MYVHPIDIRYGEVDRQGVVFNAHYLAYCDHASDSWFRQLHPTFEELGWEVMVKAASIEFHGRAGIGETLDLVLSLERVGRTSFDIAFSGKVVDDLVVSARITYVVVGTADQRPVPIPAELQAHLEA